MFLLGYNKQENSQYEEMKNELINIRNWTNTERFDPSIDDKNKTFSTKWKSRNISMLQSTRDREVEGSLNTCLKQRSPIPPFLK